MADTSASLTASARQRAKGTTATIARNTRQPRQAHRPANSHAGRTARDAGNEWLTVEEVCAELRIGRRTFERWRTLGVAPRATRPTRNGPLKIKRSWLEEWAEDGAL
jgi:hypothetical protein